MDFFNDLQCAALRPNLQKLNIPLKSLNILFVDTADRIRKSFLDTDLTLLTDIENLIKASCQQAFSHISAYSICIIIPPVSL